MIRRHLGNATMLFVAFLLITASGCGRNRETLAGPDAASAASETPAPGAGLAAGVEHTDADAGEDSEENASRAHPIDAPTTITTPGNYRLTRDLTVTQGDGIVVQASDVRLWLGGHTLTGPGNKSGRAILIDGARNVHVRGGRIRRFGLGVVLLGAQGCRVREVSIEGGDETADPANGNPPQIGVMLINSAMNDIADNRLRDVNLGLFVRGGASTHNVLRGNVVVGGQHGLLGICYNPAPTGGAAGPYGDRITGNTLARFGTGIAASAGSQYNRFVANTIRYFDMAWSDKNGTNTFDRNRTQRIAR